jgi:hypothetical protein
MATSAEPLLAELAAFGRTLETRAGAAITPDATASRPLVGAQRRWPGVLVAAGVVGALVGLGFLAVNRSADSTTADLASSPSQTVPSRTAGPASTAAVPVEPVTMTPLGTDPLGLTRSGWSLDQRQSFTFHLDDDTALAEVEEVFSGPVPDLDVSYIDAESSDQARAVVAAIAELGDEYPDAVPLPTVAALASGAAVDGYRLGRGFAVAAVSGTGNLVVAFEIESGEISDDVLSDLIARAGAFQSAQPWTDVNT